MKNNYVVIMAGGKGTRLWPLSRINSPKQFQNLVGDNTMIVDTYQRIKQILSPKNIFISTTKDYQNEIQKQLPEIPKENYIIEPMAKNTAPAIGLVATKIAHIDPNATITTIASDHIILNTNNFIHSINACQEMIENNQKMIGIVGIKPTSPHTGYGYIQKNKVITKIDNLEIFEVNKFVEKPDKLTAKKYLKDGNYFWNASYFTFKAKYLIDVIKKYEPVIYNSLNHIKKSIGKKNENKTIISEFHKMPELAIDYLIEKLNSVFVIPVDLGWDDIGSWEAIKNISSRISGDDNITKGNNISIDNKDTLIYAQDKLIAVLGVRNLIVVDTKDAILICDKNSSQDVKNIIELLKNNKDTKYL